MVKSKHHYSFNIRDSFSNSDYVMGNQLSWLISNFTCPKNPDVEHFLKNNAVDFTKKNQSVSYLVFSDEVVPSLVGYFALTIKPLTIGISDIPSNTQRKKLERVGRLGVATQTYATGAYLIAQLGKNFHDGANKKITGSELLDAAFDVIKELQYQAGGMVVFVETEDNKKLIDFYHRNNFYPISEPKNDNQLIQLYRII